MPSLVFVRLSLLSLLLSLNVSLDVRLGRCIRRKLRVGLVAALRVVRAPYDVGYAEDFYFLLPVVFSQKYTATSWSSGGSCDLKTPILMLMVPANQDSSEKRGFST